jgi:hypothetical protein
MNIMNIKKIGLSALAGSLAMVSANAVEYTMSGGLMATYTTQDDANKQNAGSGKGIGTATDLSFNASGELDNGFTVGYFMGVDTNGALSNTSSQMTIGMGSIGTLQVNNKFGSKANAIDDISPTAYNETWDGLTSGTANNPSFFGSGTSSGSIDYRIPAQEFEGVTLNASITYDPNHSVGPASKGGVAASNGGKGVAYTLQMAHESGLEVGAGVEMLDAQQGQVAGSQSEGTDRYTAYVKYAMSGITVSYQQSEQNTAHNTAAAAASRGADKTSEMTGVAYTAGDITVSYGESEMKTMAVGATAELATIKLDSVQVAYVMGAMTVSAATSSTSNVDGVSGEDYNENTLAVSFAF